MSKHRVVVLKIVAGQLTVTAAAEQYGISRGTRLAKHFSGDTRLVDEVARQHGVKSLQVHTTDLIPNCLTVLPDTPPLLVVGEPLYRSLTEAQKRFVFAWGSRLSAAGLVPFVSMTDANLPALWVALSTPAQPRPGATRASPTSPASSSRGGSRLVAASRATTRRCSSASVLSHRKAPAPRRNG